MLQTRSSTNFCSLSSTSQGFTTPSSVDSESLNKSSHKFNPNRLKQKLDSIAYSIFISANQTLSHSANNFQWFPWKCFRRCATPSFHSSQITKASLKRLREARWILKKPSRAVRSFDMQRGGVRFIPCVGLWGKEVGDGVIYLHRGDWCDLRGKGQRSPPERP